MSAIIKLKDVWKIYQMGSVEVPALRGIDLEIEKGDFVAIRGPSGSGKSTIMNIVGCLDIPSKGVVLLENNDIAKMHDSDLAQIRGKKIGFVFQQFNLLPTLNALENVMLPLELQNSDSNEAKIRAKELLELVGLRDRIDHLPSQLSGGQMQRVAIARALAVDPDIILADEPTGNLDSTAGSFIMDFLDKIHRTQGKTIIVVTHDMSLVNYAQTIVLLKDGKIQGIKKNKHR